MSIIIFQAKARLSIFSVGSEEFLHPHGEVFAKIFYGSSVYHYITLITLPDMRNMISVLVYIGHSDGPAPHCFMYSVDIIIPIELGNSGSSEIRIRNGFKKYIEHLEDSKEICVFFQESHRGKTHEAPGMSSSSQYVIDTIAHRSEPDV